MGGMPTSDLKIWQSRQTERFTDWANSPRESSPRTSSLIMAIIFSTRLSNTQTPGEMFTDSPRLIDGCARNPSKQNSAEYHVRVKSGLGRLLYCGKTESGKSKAFRILRVRIHLRMNHAGRLLIEGATFYYRDKKLSTGTLNCNDFEMFVYIRLIHCHGFCPVPGYHGLVPWRVHARRYTNLQTPKQDATALGRGGSRSPLIAKIVRHPRAK